MKTAVKYLILTFVFATLSSGVVIAAFMDVYDSLGYKILPIISIMTALFIAAVLFNDRKLIPGLLLKRYYRFYILATVAMICLLSGISLAMEYFIRLGMNFPMRIRNYGSLWILVDILGNGLLLMTIFLGLGMLQIFNCWQKEVSTEVTLTDKLEAYIRAINSRLNPSQILNRLDSISSGRDVSPQEVESRIRDLSAYLRRQLYELPEPPKVDSGALDEDNYSPVADRLVAKRYSAARHLIFLGVLLFISCGAFFDAPDRPVLTLDRMWGVLSMFGVLAGIAYINILWLYPRFMKRGNIRHYLLSVGILVFGIIDPLLFLVQTLTYEPNVYDKQMPALVIAMSSLGSLSTLTLFIGGISAVLLLRDWIRTRRRIVLLRAETIRREYSYLRKQINPHFLFNVLNSIGITAYDEPEVSAALMDNLKSLLVYQLKDLPKESTVAADEIKFLNSYLALEKSRRDNFDYIIESGSCAGDKKIPTLMFIPFVENAVKYSSRAGGFVAISFASDDDSLTFECSNSFDRETDVKPKQGGIGLTNTRRRLDLLFENNYTLNVCVQDNIYKVELKIPVE